MPTVTSLIAIATSIAFALLALPTFSRTTCAKPQSIVEERICSSQYATLRKIDHDLDFWYQRALTRSANASELRANQGEWVHSLESCLTADQVEPRKYVCDSVNDPSKKTQCYRDFCLVRRYVDRARTLYRLSLEGMPRRYTLSTKWPTGIRQAMQPMNEDDRPLCRSVNNTLRKLGPLVSAFKADNPIVTGSPWEPVLWKPIDRSVVLPIAIRLEQVKSQKWAHVTDMTGSERFVARLRSRLEAGELTVSIAASPAIVVYAARPARETVILRYQRWAPRGITTDDDRNARVEYFASQDDGLANLVSLGPADDTFLYQGRLHFVSAFERSSDDAWRQLPLPQPELFVYKVAESSPGSPFLLTACHFLFSGAP
jgi:hypothetical protein